MRRPLRIEYPGELYCRHVRLLHRYAAQPLPVVDVLGDQGKWHREAIEEFSIVVKNDGIKFRSLTYQELIICVCYNLTRRTE